MNRFRGNGSSHNGHGPDPGEPSVTVRCPNADCGKVYTVHRRYAGKKGKCLDCGAKITVPNAPPPVGRHGPNGIGRHDGTTGVTTSQDEFVLADAGVRGVNVGCIGRGHAGKTALFHALGEGLVGDFLPSGLHVDANDPREVARMIREAEETLHLLHLSGLPPTLQASRIHYCVYNGDEPVVAYRMREVIGQILTHTLPDSAPELQARYGQYLKSLVNTHALWAVVPCPPPDPGPTDRRRYANDLHITLAYLREALRLRPLDRPAIVALVLSKIDALFDDPAEARASLTDDVLRDALAPLVQLIDTSARVSDAAIIPVTAFGFGNAVLRESGGEREGVSLESADDPFGTEPIWLLREDAVAQPYNVDTLFLWTLLLGLLAQAEGGAAAAPEVGEVCQTLRADLDAGDPWLVPLKGGVEGGGLPTLGVQGSEI
jgi:hypothetical protein